MPELTRRRVVPGSAPAPLMPDTGGNLNLATYEVAKLPAPTFPARRKPCRLRSVATVRTCDRKHAAYQHAVAAVVD